MVAQAIWQRLSDTQRAIFPKGAVLLAALHDIGKLTPGFQLKSPHWGLIADAAGSDFYEGNHAKVSQAFLATFPDALTAGKAANWALAVGGHHGSYPTSKAKPERIFEDSLTWPQALREELFTELRSIFGDLPEVNIPKGAAIHWLTGFITFADWIGSDTGFFPLCASGKLQDRVVAQVITGIAESAVSGLGWQISGELPARTFTELFPCKEPKPLQQILVQSMDRPGLYIVEAPMGAGKTEAALAGSQRRWKEGDERGLYFALPTQLTSNRIHQRVGQFLENALSNPEILSLVHGNAWMREDRIRSITPTAANVEGADDANAWYASGRKALLAPFGTGTIDQAIMCSMPVKHSGLRLFALSGKVVILDEVHSYDPYTSALVDQCVKWLLEVGCTLIVLSATLSLARRAALVRAAGAGECHRSMAYPLITKIGRNSPTAEAIEVPSADLPSTTVFIEMIGTGFDAIWQQIATAAESGACVLVIRNTVALAQETYRLLVSLCRDQGIKFGLLHSRFPQFERDEKEDEWMKCLGSDSSNRPSGCILVATQVVEQSVDIDADLLVTDLAPVDLILQRLGRLHRHPRPRPSGFETPRCLVLAPPADWSAGRKTIEASLGPSAFVYPPFALYQAERVLSALPAGKITLPQDIRGLIEASAQIPADLPAGAQEALHALEALTDEMTGTASQFDVFNSVVRSDTERSDRQPKTRWKSPATAMLILLKSEPGPYLDFLNGARLPLRGSMPFDPALAIELHRNAVRIPFHLVRDLMAHQPPWLSQHIDDAVIAVVLSDSSACEFYPSNRPNSYRIDYHKDMGVIYVRNISTLSASYDEPEEDGWF